MRKFIAFVAIVFCMTVVAAAQDVPQVEIFGGYSLFHFDKQGIDTVFGPPPPGLAIHQNLHGWEGAVQFNANKWLGIVADFSGHYGTPVELSGVGEIKGNIYNFLFGPSINFRGEKAKGYVHALFGGNHVALNESASLGTPAFSDNAFAFAIGGGLDVNVKKSVAIRVGQFDYIYSNHDFGLGHQNNYRFSAGIVLNLGERQ